MIIKLTESQYKNIILKEQSEESFKTSGLLYKEDKKYEIEIRFPLYKKIHAIEMDILWDPKNESDEKYKVYIYIDGETYDRTKNKNEQGALNVFKDIENLTNGSFMRTDKQNSRYFLHWSFKFDLVDENMVQQIFDLLNKIRIKKIENYYNVFTI